MTRLKETTVGAPSGVSSGRFAAHDRSAGDDLTADAHSYWDAVAVLDEVIARPVPAGYTIPQAQGYEAANTDVTLTHRMPWAWTAGQLERKFAVASDEDAPWRDGSESSELFWDARADRLQELWETFNAVAPLHVQGEDAADPNGCAFCGRDARSHGLYFTDRGGAHRYVAPSDEQRLLRMRRRRALAG